MIHKMKLNKKPFEDMKKGVKEVEFRLYDEKRQKIQVKDKIEFSKLPDLNEKLLVEVTDLYKEKNFKDLFKNFYKDNQLEEMMKTIYKIYTPQEEEKYGVLGIKIKINTDELKKDIENFIPYNEQEEKDKDVMLSYINNFDNTLTRQNKYGHFTSSAFVLNKQRTKILMIYHNIYNSWAWVGGHNDGDSNSLNVAIKEAKEETGIKNVKPITNDIYSLEIITVNGHEKKGEYIPSHTHLNLTYLLEADEEEQLYIKQDENSGVKWVLIEDILKLSNEDWIKNRVYSKIINKMKKDKVIKQ